MVIEGTCVSTHYADRGYGVGRILNITLESLARWEASPSRGRCCVAPSGEASKVTHPIETERRRRSQGLGMGKEGLPLRGNGG